MLAGCFSVIHPVLKYSYYYIYHYSGNVFFSLNCSGPQGEEVWTLLNQVQIRVKVKKPQNRKTFGRPMNASRNSTSLAQHCFELPEPTSLKSLKTAAFIFIFVLSFSGNFLLVVIVTRRVLTTLNILITNIAISDLLLIFLGIPEQILYIHRDKEVGYVINFIMCKVTPFTNGLSTSVSMMSLAVTAVERFQAIVYPLKFKSMQKRRCLIIIAICWLIGTLFSSCNLVTFQAIPGKTYHCTYSWEPFTSNEKGLKVYTLTYIVCFIAIPLTIMITLYAVLMHSLKKQKTVVCQLPAGKDDEQKKTEK